MLTTLFTQKSDIGQIVAWDFTANAGTEGTVRFYNYKYKLKYFYYLVRGPGLSNPAGANAFTGSFGAVRLFNGYDDVGNCLLLLLSGIYYKS